MMSYTSPMELPQAMIAERDAKYGISTAAKAESRATYLDPDFKPDEQADQSIRTGKVRKVSAHSRRRAAPNIADSVASIPSPLPFALFQGISFEPVSVDRGAPTSSSSSSAREHAAKTFTGATETEVAEGIKVVSPPA